MISVYRGSDYFEAQLLVGLLQQQNISVFLQGASLQGGLGEVPVVGHLSIMVDDQDLLRARELIEAYERGDLMLGDDA